MLASLHLTRFRAFKSLSVEGLTRVNLFLGGNNAGKTCVLEAAEILAAGGQPWILLRSPTRRGDGFGPGGEAGPRPIVDLRHLFHEHQLEYGVSFRIEGRDPPNNDHFVSCSIKESDSQSDFSSAEPLEPIPPLAIEISGDLARTPRTIDLTSSGGLPIDQAARRSPGDDESARPMNFISTNDPDYRISPLWDRIVLTPEEGMVTTALQIIDPAIERIAALSRVPTRNSPTSIVVKLKGSDERIPIGTMGDGVRRLLVLAVNLANSSGGQLFVDEIDTGLHHSVMIKMWRLIIETARTLDVQVFATTHSLDCVRALATICETMPSASSDVSIHRIERGKESSIRYSADEALIAVKQEMEIR